MHRSECDGFLYRWLVAAGLAWLEYNKETVNQLNVFPVPDGDTGTNMHLTMRKAYDEVSRLEKHESHIGVVASAVARGALMGARGNSGVILSQLLAGFAKGVEDLESFNVQQFAHACSIATQYAYRAVVNPVEGTILTVSREAYESVQRHVDAHPDTTLRQTFEVLIAHAKTSLANTPNLLPVLKDAGVVDSGGAGFLAIMEGMLRFLEGKPVVTNGDTEKQVASGVGEWQDALIPEDEEGYGYDVQFLIHGENLDVPKIRADIDALGWSTLVVGDPQLVKVHVHVHNPAEPINYAIATLGAEIDDIVVENMQLQYKEYVKNRVEREQGHTQTVAGVAVIAVSPGDGLTELFVKDLSVAYVIGGGQTMNPSTEDFVAAINAIDNTDVILLPNNKNIIMAAQQAAAIASNKQVRVVPSKTIPQGIGALVGYLSVGSSSDLDPLTETMREAMNNITTIEVTYATRTVNINEVEVTEGQVIGLVDGKLQLAGESLDEVVTHLIETYSHPDKELVTLYYGSDIDGTVAQSLVNTLTEQFDELAFELVKGGQPLYPYLISVE